MEGQIRMTTCPRCGRETPAGGPHAMHGTGCAILGEAVAIVDRLAREADMEDAHAEGMHDDLPREGCPECER